MIVSASSSSSTLMKQLEANGLSADKAKLVQSDVTAAESASTTGTGLTLQNTTVRGALDQRIAADVSSGKLSASDAATVKKTLDDIDSASGGSGITLQSASSGSTATAAASSSSAGSSGGGGGGGGGGSATKTVLSETITVVGSTKTTDITYTDNSTETDTSTATDADEARYGKVKADDASNSNAQQYLSTIEPGSLIDKAA